MLGGARPERAFTPEEYPVTRIARLPERFNLLSCLVALAMGCSSNNDSGPTLPGSVSGGTTGSSNGNSSGGNSTSGNATGSGGGGIDLPPANGNSGGGGGIDGCVETSSTAMPLPPNLAFLIDTSGSMDKRPEGAPTSAPTKWVSTRDALSDAFTEMSDGTGTGLLFYPNNSGTFGIPPRGGMGRGGSSGMGSGGATGAGDLTCFTRRVAVAQAPLDMAQRNRVLTALRNTMANGIGTPTHDAYNFAVETIKASTLPGPKYVVLVTDGAPTFSVNCGGDGTAEVDAAPIVQAVADAAKAGIKTFVIGSPGSESALSSLSKMATEGGTAKMGCSDAGPNYCHFDMTTAPDFSAALNEAFKAITSQVVTTCNYNIPAPSGGKEIDFRLVDVSFTTGSGQTSRVAKDPSEDQCNQGWQFSQDKKQIMLCPDMCDNVKKDNGAKVNVVFACTPITR